MQILHNLCNLIAAKEVGSLTVHNKQAIILQRFDDYPITRMDLEFFNWVSRKKTLNEMDVVLVP